MKSCQLEDQSSGIGPLLVGWKRVLFICLMYLLKPCLTTGDSRPDMNRAPRTGRQAACSDRVGGIGPPHAISCTIRSCGCFRGASCAGGYQYAYTKAAAPSVCSSPYWMQKDQEQPLLCPQPQVRADAAARTNKQTN